MDQRISLVTLGVADVQESAAFYGRLGWRRSEQSQAEIVFFDAGGIVLGLFGRAALADDADVPPQGSGFRAVALAQNLPTRDAVDAALADAVKAGARVVRRAEEVFWGGYSGYFEDPDGHLWEVAFNPHWSLDETGRIVLPG
ncbi:VOC family protein [Microbaculum marinum]|uniref:VOC family protein n=1 Tax=Microbaculum marinum TaxID=1764581 RepID=A0AAW9RVX4_9HYPH